MEERVLRDLNARRRLVLQQSALCRREPDTCLAPFFAITASEAFSAYTTAEALRSVQKLIAIGLVSPEHDDAEEIINKVNRTPSSSSSSSSSDPALLAYFFPPTTPHPDPFFNPHPNLSVHPHPHPHLGRPGRDLRQVLPYRAPR